MTRSYDHRRFPRGPKTQPGEGSALRGLRRTGPIGAVVPGDDVEVARELARLRELLGRKKSSGGDELDHLIALWSYDSPPASTGVLRGVWRVPEISEDPKTFNLTLAWVRFEGVPDSGTYTFQFQKSDGGGAFSATTITSVSISASREGEDTTDLGTVESGQLLRINASAVGVGGTGPVSLQLEGEDSGV